jgi:uncharacterized protein
MAPPAAEAATPMKEYAMGRTSVEKMEEPKPDWADPAVVGLMGFGTTTMLAGLSNLPQPYGSGLGTTNAPVFAMAMAFGGSAQLIAGIIDMRRNNMFGGAAFMGYGAFWWAFTLMLLWDPAGAGLTTYGISAFAFVWFLFTLTFFICSFKRGWGIVGVFGLLTIAFLLLTVKFWSLAANAPGCTSLLGCGPFAANATTANWLVGGEIFLTGILAWYVASSILAENQYGRRILPR